MPTSIEIPWLSSRVTTEVDPNVVLDEADAGNTERTVNESQDHTTVSEDGPPTNDIPTAEASDGTYTVASATKAGTTDANEGGTTANAPTNENAESSPTEHPETPHETRRDDGSASTTQRFSRAGKQRNPHYAHDRILAYDFSRWISNTISVGKFVLAAKTRGNHNGTYRSTQLTRTIDFRCSNPLSSIRNQARDKPVKNTLRLSRHYTPCSHCGRKR